MVDIRSIAVLIPEFPGQTHIFFWREILGLRSLGYNVNIISTRPPKSRNFHEFVNDIDDTFYLIPIPYLRVLNFLLLHPGWLLSALRYCLNLRGSLRTRLRTCLFIPVAANLIMYCVRNSIQHVHVHSSADASHILALCSMVKRFNYSVCIHGNLNQYGDNHQAKLSAASCIITVTRPLREEVLSSLPSYSPDKVHVLPMGVDISKFLPRKYIERDSSPYILTSISRLAYVKGHSFTLQALAELRDSFDFRYQIVGDGEMRASLEAEVRTLGLEDRVEFLGFRQEGEVNNILQNTDIFILTSFGYGEAAPVAIMEAMACGVAPVCSIIGGTGDMIKDTFDGMLVRQKDIEDIKRALSYLLGDKKRLEIIGENARKTAEQKFCHNTSATALIRHITHSSPSEKIPDIAH